ncbi:MAG: AraC family transcriptional regulator [Aureispira sp.]|nr:AraC family transcriptional regulator [Aureispira sp.]
MSYTTVQLAPFYIIGLSVSTKNANGQAQKDIGQLWQDWFSQNISAKIPNKLSEDIYNVYTEYESDHNGVYTSILGHRVDSLADTPAGLVGNTIQGGQFALYQVQGELPAIVAQTWEKIWAELSSKRLYSADFDVYGPRVEGEPAKVKTYVSLV